MSGLMRQDLYAELYQVENSHWWHQHKRAVCLQRISRMKTGKVLDIGAGTGKILEELKAHGWQAKGVDAEPAAAQECKKRGIILQTCDVGNKSLPYQSNSFDLVLTLDFLEHVQNEIQVINKIKRVLKPDGKLLISVPAYPRLYSYWDKMLGHYRRYSKADLTQLIKKSGLKIEFLSYYFSWLLLPAVIIRMIKKMFNIKMISDFQTNTNNFLILFTIKILSKIELLLLKYINLPFGLSLICVASTQKKYQS